MITQERQTADEVVERGRALYEQNIRAHVEAANVGRYIAINVLTGQYEIGDDHLATVKRLRAREPEAIICTLLIGYPAAAAIGAHLHPTSR